MLKKALAGSFFLYLVALMTSMAGMEIFGWLTFFLAFIVSFVEWKKNPEQRAFFTLGADGPLLALIVIVVLGYLINSAKDADFVFMIGSMRWAILMYGIAYAARWTKLSEKAFVPLMVVASIVAFHGMFEYFTSWDLIRNRPVGSYANEEGQARAAGFFSMPTTFAHAFAMTVCFPLAAVILRWGETRARRLMTLFALLMLLIVLAASFTRGAWISLSAAIGVMTLIVSRRLFVGVMIASLLGGALLLSVNPVFRQRAATVFDLSYGSNSERAELWRANWWIFKEYPLLGIGLNDNERRTEEYNIKYGFPKAKVGNAHNTYLQFLSGTGILGLSAYLAFIGFYLWLAFRLLKVIPPEKMWHRVFVFGSIGAQISLHVGGLTDCNFKDAEVQHQYIAILAMLSYLRFVYLKQGEAVDLAIDAGSASSRSQG